MDKWSRQSDRGKGDIVDWGLMVKEVGSRREWETEVSKNMQRQLLVAAYSWMRFDGRV